MVHLFLVSGIRLGNFHGFILIMAPLRTRPTWGSRACQVTALPQVCSLGENKAQAPPRRSDRIQESERRDTTRAQCRTLSVRVSREPVW